MSQNSSFWGVVSALDKSVALVVSMMHCLTCTFKSAAFRPLSSLNLPEVRVWTGLRANCSDCISWRFEDFLQWLQALSLQTHFDGGGFGAFWTNFSVPDRTDSDSRTRIQAAFRNFTYHVPPLKFYPESLEVLSKCQLVVVCRARLSCRRFWNLWFEV